MNNIERFKENLSVAQKNVQQVEKHTQEKTLSESREIVARNNSEKIRNENENKRMFSEIGLLDFLNSIIDQGIIRYSDEPVYDYSGVFRKKISKFTPAKINWKNDISREVCVQNKFELNFENKANDTKVATINFTSDKKEGVVSMQYRKNDTETETVVITKNNLESSLAIAISEASHTGLVNASDEGFGSWN